MKLQFVLKSLLVLSLLLGTGIASAGEMAEEKADSVCATSNDTHVITREASANADTDRVEYFTHDWFNGDAHSKEEGGSCSGRCSGNVCICAGDPTCCGIGCDLCFKILEQAP